MNKKVLPLLTIDILLNLSNEYSKHIQHERFGQYVTNRTSFNLENYNGVNIFYESDYMLVLDALTQYCIDTCNN